VTVVIHVFVTPGPIVVLITAIEPIEIPVFHLPLIHVPAIGGIFALVPLMPIVMRPIFIPHRVIIRTHSNGSGQHTTECQGSDEFSHDFNLPPALYQARSGPMGETSQKAVYTSWGTA
jgi:hypothetical protein